MGITELTQIEDLPFSESLAVIINVNTRVVTALALASAVRHAHRPVLLIDCESRDGSADTFAELAHRLSWDFYLLRWPIRSHGIALDHLFRAVPTRTVLLIDSDLEIEDPGLTDWMSQSLAEAKDAYGAGFLHAAEDLGPPQHRLPPGVGRYAERMWIPLVLLDVESVRETLASGATFEAAREFPEFPSWPRFSRLMYLRFRMPFLRKLPAARRPAFVDYDTGARLHARLLAQGRRFIAKGRWTGVRHLHGVTRDQLKGARGSVAARLGVVAPPTTDDPQAQARQRLRDVYGIDLPG